MINSRSTRLCAVLLAGLAFGACKGGIRQARGYAVTFRSLSDDGEPLANVAIGDNGHPLGLTNERGVLHARLEGSDGEERVFTVGCPQGYSHAEERVALQLRTLNGASGEHGSELEVRCRPDRRMAALLVSAPGFAGLPILVHGREVGRTDASGVAHLALRGEPRTPMRVVLDTSSRPRVTPTSPHKDVRIGDRDEIVVFSPGLTEVDPPKPRRHHKKEEVVVEPPKPIRPEQLN
jgi:hypothetical protein